jgi:ABC-2 type transport system permease protein
MKPPLEPGFLHVASREVRWILRDRVARLLIVGVPLIAMTALCLTFSQAVIRDLSIVVVDADRSPASLMIVQAIDAAPGVAVQRRANDLSDAMHAIRSGAAIAATYIPENFERDVAAGRRPQISVFYNSQFMTPGNAASRALGDAVRGAIAELAPESAQRPQQVGALVIEQYVLTNPALNYIQFLLRALLPTVLHVVMAVAACYAIGSEFSRRNLRRWLRAAGGSPLVALAGKLAPLLAIFTIEMAVLAAVIHGGFDIPFRGDAALIVLAAFLFIAAYLGLAALLVLLTRNLALGLSLVGIICSPAFGFAGVGFPVLGMPAFAHGWSAILPLRWYIQILFDQGARGAPVADSALALAALAALAIVCCGGAWLRLTNIARNPPARTALPGAPPAVRSDGLLAAIGGELRRILGDPGIAGLMIMAPLIYGAFYPQPYLGQTLRDLPIAVVDHDRTELSRQLVMTLDADAAVAVAVRSDTLADAQQAIFERRAFGILQIPEGTTRDILKGLSARLPAYVDSAYFLVFSRALQGITEAVGTVSFDLATHSARQGGQGDASLAAVSPATILSVPLYNPTGGYGSYIVPAAFMLILQQTLLIGAAMLGGVAFESGGLEARRARSTPAAVLGQGLAHLIIYVPALLLYLVILPRVYGFSVLGGVAEVFVFAASFILATSFMGQAAGAWFRHRETAVILFMAIGLPQFFLVGVSWPLEAVPPLMRAIGHIFPSETGIDGMVRLNQMGASLNEVLHDWLAVLALAIAYFLLAVGGNGLRREAPHVA